MSIVNNSVRNRRSPEEFSSALVGRLNAMARAHALLARASWQDVDLGEIIRLEGDCHGAGRIVAAGEAVRLPALAALPVAMVIHELATNASKYGALSVKDGRVDVTWLQKDGWVRLEWIERGGPVPGQLGPSGFGTALIEGQMRHQMRGRCEMSFGVEGLAVTLEFPVDQAGD